MITRISSGSSPAGAIFYNEHKVGKGEADRLTIRNFEGVRVPVHQLTGNLIADRLQDQAALNERIKQPTFHVSLALAKGEQVPAHDLVAIADQYMQGMGYGRQPYAVYQHHDTEHPHIHIVSVRIDAIGSKVSDKFERERSNKLRQQIEKDFGLQIAEQVDLRPERTLLQPIEYGKGDLKMDLSSVVQNVLREFTFSSFFQYNQLLKIYNVQATEIPKEGQKPGLKYAAVDGGGQQQGAAIKASSLAYRPTWEVVERRIGAGKKIKGDRIGRLRKAADCQLTQSKGWDDFQQRLSRIGVETIPHLGKDGNLFGISFLDTRQRIIYTGSELGKSFTAGALKASLGATYQSPGLRTPAPELTARQADKLTKERPVNTVQAPSKSGETAMDNKPAQSGAEERQQQSMQDSHAELMRQLLHALGESTGDNDSEQDLKRMLKKSRKPRLS